MLESGVAVAPDLWDSWSVGDFAPIRPSERRDRGLAGNFTVGLDPELDRLIGAATPKLAGTARMLVDEAYQAHKMGWEAVAYSRRRAWYSAARLGGFRESYNSILSGVEILERQRFITNSIAPPQPDRLHARQSRLKLTAGAIAFLNDRGGVKGPRKYLQGESVRLKHRPTGKLLPVGRSGVTLQMRREMALINEAAHAAHWEPASADIYDRRGDLCVVGGNDGHRVWLNTAAAGFMQMLTERGNIRDWTCGRMYGWGVQNAPRHIRRRGTVANDRVAEVDYRNLHLRLALWLANRPFSESHDLFEPIRELSGERREIVKRAVCIGLNAENIQSCRRAIACEISYQGGRSHPNRGDFERAENLTTAIGRIYPSLNKLLGTDVGVRLMRVESTIVRAVSIYLAKKSVELVPIHDALLVPSNAAGVTAEAMERVSQIHLGQSIPTSTFVAG